MKRFPREWTTALLILMVSARAAFSSSPAATLGYQPQENQSTSVIFFDVSDLPARIDEPKLQKTAHGYVLKGAIANRSSEQLLGVRLVLLVTELSGKLKSRVTWTEAFDLPGYSIKTFAFHPELSEAPRADDQVFLAVDEVIGYETIWRAMEAEKALRAFSRGHHDVMPVVRTVANKFDPRTNALMPVIHQER